MEVPFTTVVERKVKVQQLLMTTDVQPETTAVYQGFAILVKQEVAKEKDLLSRSKMPQTISLHPTLLNIFFFITVVIKIIKM